MNYNKSEAIDFTTYARSFEEYKWFKPLLMVIIMAVMHMACMILIVLGVGLSSYLMGDTELNVFKTLSKGYDSFNAYTSFGAIITLGSVAVYLPILMFAAAMIKYRPFQSYASSRGGWNRDVFRKCLLAALLVSCIPLTIETLLETGSMVEGKFTVVGLFLCLVLGPLQCIAEEFIFRGFLLQAFGGWFRNPAIAIVLQAIVFAMMHPYNIYGVIEVFAFGIIAGIIAWYTRGLEASSALHIVNNMTVFLLTGFGIGSVQKDCTVISMVTSLAVNLFFAAVIVQMSAKKHWFEY